MTPPYKPRGRIALLAFLNAAILAVGLFGAAGAAASPAAGGIERREARAAERAERHAQRQQEAEARRAARAEERAARRSARHADGIGGGEAPTGAPTPTFGHADSGCRVTVSVSSPQILAGETVTVSGILSCPSAATAATQQVTIYQRSSDGHGGVPTAVETLTPLPDGTFTMTSAALDTNTVFQAREGRHRARASVKVAPQITLSLLAPTALASVSTKHSRPLTSFTGTVSPASPGARVALQVAYAASGGRWRSIAWTHVAEDGTYSIAHVLKTPGATSIRAILHTGRQNAVAVSEALSYEAAQPQNPALTIETSADPLIAGQTVTISGVTTGQANAPVKLLARTSSGAFTVAAEATTDGEGNYSFPQTPLANTLYRVSDAATRSTVLFQGVAFALTPEPDASSAPAGTPVTFSGTVSPAASAHPVLLEQRSPSGIGFHVIATGTVGIAPAYSIAHTFTKPGVAVLRVRVPGEGHNVTTTSATFELTVEA